MLPETDHAKIQLIYHGVDVDNFFPSFPAEPPPKVPVILSVGRLVEKKGFPDLLEALRRLKQGSYRFKAMIYGEGPQWDELSKRIKETGLEGLVTLAGARRQHELVPLFQKSTIFALTPSVSPDGDRDGIPNVLVEAMACGLPVVSTAVAGIPELVIDDYNGLLFAPHDLQGIAAGLAALITDEIRRRRLGEAARKTVLDRFDLKAGACHMAGLFRQMGVG
jgi:glycosyltransferase involved in cell wall biosynthesis